MDKLIRKARWTIVIFLIFILPISFFSIFLPMKNELEKSIVQNFILVSSSKFQTLEQFIARSTEGAESLSSRSAIRTKIAEYKNNQISMNELKEFTQPRYLDGVNALENVISAARIVDHQVIAEYGDQNFQSFDVESRELQYQLKIDDNDKSLMVGSPILEQKRLLGFDIVNYNISTILNKLKDDGLDVRISDPLQVDILLQNEDIKNYDNKVSLINDGKHLSFLKPIKGTESFFVVTISEAFLFKPIARLTVVNIIAFVIGLLIIFLVVNYIFVYNTKKLVVELENVVEERTLQLKIANKELQCNNELLEEEILSRRKAEASSMEKSRFLANMSHEIRTPMNGILGFLQLLENSSLNKEQLEYTEAIKTSSEILVTVINDILDISKIEAGKIELENISFNLETTIETAILPFREKVKEKGLNMNLFIGSDVPKFVVGDPTRLRQVMTNLISNAMKFTHKGDIFIEIQLKNKKDDRYEIQFTVEDTGIGIKEEVIKKLFNPFTQADSSSTRKFGGTGLGLVISKSIIEMMGGKIGIESIEGKGTKTIFTVALGKPEAIGETIFQQDGLLEVKKQNKENKDFCIIENTEKPGHLKSRPEILLVEDNEVNRMFFIKLLEMKGFTCNIAVNGLEAVKACLEKSYDMVFMDCQMPLMNGYEATRRIRQAEGDHKHTPIIAMTAYAMKGDAEKCLEAGMDDYLCKPIEMDQVIRLIDKYSS